MIDFKKIGRNNRQRGGAWERGFAKAMGWTYVGSVRASLFPGDVVDGFRYPPGRWVGECKTQQPGELANLSVKSDWISQMFNNSERSGRHPVLALRITRKKTTYVVLPHESQTFLGIMSAGVLKPDTVWTTKTRGAGLGFVIQRSWLDRAGWEIANVEVERTRGSNKETFHWWVMAVEDFRRVLDQYEAHVDDVKQEERAIHRDKLKAHKAALVAAEEAEEGQ